MPQSFSSKSLRIHHSSDTISCSYWQCRKRNPRLLRVSPISSNWISTATELKP
jgi:hypothetical protein